MPRQAKTSELWERFIKCVMELDPVPEIDQTKIGNAVGVGQTMVSSYKTGPKMPSIDHAIALANYAKMCTEYLLTGNGPQRPWWEMDPLFIRLVQCWENLSPVNQGKLIEQAELLFGAQTQPRMRARIPNINLPKRAPPKPSRH